MSRHSFLSKFSSINPPLTEENFIDWLILSSSDRLRAHLNLEPLDLLPGPVPDFVTRKDASLDNYFAELLLRTIYTPSSSPPAFHEIVLRGSEKNLPTSDNPQVAGSILIGIGGESSNPDFVGVYDEHTAGGSRKARSASEVVFERHYRNLAKGEQYDGVLMLLSEISNIDAYGKAGENHLSKLVKNLHHAQTECRPDAAVMGNCGTVKEFEQEWKRAILDGILAAFCLFGPAVKNLDDQTAGRRLREEWKAYRGKRESIVSDGSLPPVDGEIFGRLINRTTIVGKDPDALLTLRRILAALERCWPVNVMSIIMRFLFESLVQLQSEYDLTSKMTLDEIPLKGTGCSMFWYVMKSGDKVPHRGIMTQINKTQKKSFLVLRDPFRQTTAVFRSNEIDISLFEKVIMALETKEPRKWYVMRKDDGTYSDFILNGSRSYLAGEPSTLDRETFMTLFSDALT